MKLLKCTLSLVLAVLIFAGCAPRIPVTVSSNTAVTSSIASSSTSVSSKTNVSSKTASKPTSSTKKSSTAIVVSGGSGNSKPKTTAQYNPGSIYPKSDTYTPIPSNQYWYYSALPSSLKPIYTELCKNIEGMATGLIPLGKFSKDDVSLLYTAIKTDHPEYFWLPNSYVISSVSGNISIGFDYKSDRVSVSYLVTPAERASMSKQIQGKIAEVQALLKANGSNLRFYDRELLIHDWLMNQVSYDNAAAKKPEGYPQAFTVYGALVKGKAVCEGYSRSLQLLLNFFGMNCSLVTGDTENSGHMWNIVNLNGRWYHVDPTWDDSPNSILKYTHGYFNITDTMIKRDHKIDPDFSELDEDAADTQSFNYQLPDCKVDRFSYMRVNDTMFDTITDTEITLTTGILAAAKENKTRCEFGFSDACTAFYASSAQLKSALKIDSIFDKVNGQLQSSGKQIGLNYNIALNSNGSFVIMWSYK